METYFNIRYEFDRQAVADAIDKQIQIGTPGYICVADGVVLDRANRNPDYRQIVNGSMFSICDSSYVPLYIRWIYDKRYKQYCGSEIFMDVIRSRKYRMIFMGTSQKTLDGLRAQLSDINPDIPNMQFISLPYREVQDFDYPDIADTIRQDGAQIIWIALGAPKQETFMSLLKPHLQNGVMIAIGAAFKFFSGADVKRAPQWMVRMHLEFLYRLFSEPKKQLKRCYGIVSSLPHLLFQEWRKSKKQMRH